MQVAMYYNNNDVRIEQMPVPQIGSDELLVKVWASGICGSDVLEWYRVKKAPLVLGHEIAGEIAACGENVTTYKPGQRVFVSHHIPCNTCHYCLNGNHTACHTLHTTNYDPGGFAEYLRVPSLNVDRGTFVLADELSYEVATFIEPLACVIRGQRMAGLKTGQTVLVLGSGISGLLHILTARAQGAGKIFATDVNTFRMDAAERCGTDTVLHARDDLRSRILSDNNGKLVDLVIICTGAFSAFQQALQCVDRGGTVLFFASTDPGVELPVPVNEFWRNSITLLPSYGNSPYDATVAMELLRNRRIDVQQLITHTLPLNDAARGFKLVAESNESIKVILQPHRT